MGRIIGRHGVTINAIRWSPGPPPSSPAKRWKWISWKTEVSALQGPATVTIGRVLGAHGVRGEIKVLPLTDFPERFLGMARLEVFRPAGRLMASLTVRSLRFHEAKGLFLVETEEIGDRDGAEDLKGGVVMIKASERVPLPEGSYWVDDVVGLRVVSADTGEDREGGGGAPNGSP